jgi:DNA adenine methylase
VSESAYPRPFLKWAGGKGQLTNALTSLLPDKFNAYHEPFIGGGAFFFKLYREKRIRQAFISDLNAELVDTYCAIRDCVTDVIAELSQYPHEKDFFYEMRQKNPRDLALPARAARMIYLNKTAFNGLYRVNSQGQFNVPFGRYKSPKYFDAENLQAVSDALQVVEIRCTPFESVLERAQPGDLVYFDPPYVPVSQTANFTGYQSGGFALVHQTLLRDVCLKLTENSVHVVVSNSATETVRDLYSNLPFVQTEVKAKRAINSNAAGRGKLTELVVTNYPVSV